MTLNKIGGLPVAHSANSAAEQLGNPGAMPVVPYPLKPLARWSHHRPAGNPVVSSTWQKSAQLVPCARQQTIHVDSSARHNTPKSMDQSKFASPAAVHR